VIGAGILGIPYVIAKSGLLFGLMHIIFIGLMVMVINLYVGEITLRTNGKHQLTGFAEKYIGKAGKHIMLLTMAVSIYGAMIAYLVGEGASLSALFGINPNLALVLFFVPMAYLIFRGLNIIEGAELWLNLLRLAAFVALVVFAFFKMDFGNLQAVDYSNMLLPYGVILFAFLGSAAIPEMEEELAKNRKLLKKAIIWGTVIPILVYALFSIAVVGVLGNETTEIATIGLGAALGKYAVIFANLFAIISMATAFLALGLAMKWVYQYDYRLRHSIAWLLTCLAPLSIAFLVRPSFISVLGITGAVAGGIEGTLIIMMHRKAKLLGARNPEYSVKSSMLMNIVHIAMFALGIAYVIFSLF
jgi:amino acid permease